MHAQPVTIEKLDSDRDIASVYKILSKDRDTPFVSFVGFRLSSNPNTRGNLIVICTLVLAKSHFDKAYVGYRVHVYEAIVQKYLNTEGRCP